MRAAAGERRRRPLAVWDPALTGAGPGEDGEAQRVPGPAQKLGQLPMRQRHHRAPLHRLQSVSGPDLAALSRRAAPTHRHKPVREEGGG